MNKQEFIEKLREHGAWCTECHDINGKKDRYVKAAKVRELLDQLDEPQDEKEEVPDFVAPFIEKLKTTGRRYGVELEKAYASGEDADLSEWVWFNENVLTVFRALENGYEVEKEPRWVVKDSDGEFIYDLHLCGVDTTAFSSNTTKFDVLTFRDRDKAEAVATLVEGTVEEV